MYAAAIRRVPCRLSPEPPRIGTRQHVPRVDAGPAEPHADAGERPDDAIGAGEPGLVVVGDEQHVRGGELGPQAAQGRRGSRALEEDRRADT